MASSSAEGGSEIMRWLLIAWKTDEIDESPMAYAQRRHDETYSGPEGGGRR